MNQDIKEKWVAALRSGKYEQGTNFLRDRDNKFCCLGVLCDILAPDKWGVLKDGCFIFDGRFGTLPRSISNIVGITTDGELKEDIDGKSSIATLNDTLKYNFSEIADMIEKDMLEETPNI